MGTDVAIREPATVKLSTDQLQYIANTEFVPKSMRGKLPAILACVATGRALGLSDMSSLRSINIIDGRASFSAELMVSLVRKRGHSIVGNFSGESCTVVGKRADNGDEVTVTWTTEMAREAGLLGKDNWKKYQPAMLWARAVSQLCRMLFADCFAGATHTPEELEDGDTPEFEDVAGEPQAAESADVISPGAVSQAVETLPAGMPDEQASPAATAPQKKKLDVLVGTLRADGKITNDQLYKATGRVAFTQEGEPDFIDYISEDGELHWSPLRESLTKNEASALIERLEKFAETVAA